MSSQESMRPPGCEENAAPYVLGALTEEEHESFVRHLASCAVCREEVAALQLVVDALPAVAPPRSAPSPLKRQVMAKVRAEAAAAGAPAPRRSPLRSFSWRPAVGVAVAMAGVIAIAAIALSGGSSGPANKVIKAQVTAPRASALLRLSGGHAELDLANMPQTEPNRVYEVWVKRSGAPQPTDALFTVTSKGAATVGVPGSVSGVKEILVTSEPVGGSRVPTRTPVIVANLS
ncbi:MAG TPA: anti-sigma factor [Solirubrobacteraceae bacterium]|jgi:anti-sigma-K factor RskA|nr:anti-sigma factor [Solirubrobacteraceae bacterium]